MDARKFLNKALFLATGFVFNAHALVPDLGIIVRHQPTILKDNPQSFTVDGTIEIEAERVPYKITWVSAKSGYAVEFKKIPASWTTTNISELVLFRDTNYCMLVINKAPYPCSTLRLWGDFEFNTSIERVLQTLTSLGLATSSDLVFKSISAKDFDAAKHTSNVKAVSKSIQGTYLSVLEFTRGNTLMDFDTLTYSPLMIRLPVDGTTWELSGSSEFNEEKEENRRNLIVSKKIEIREGEHLLGVVRREPLKRGSKVSLPNLPSGRASASTVPFDKFSEKGKNFLKILFLTH